MIKLIKQEYIFFTILFVSVFFFTSCVSRTNFAGNAIQLSASGLDYATCNDSDGGMDPYYLGSVFGSFNNGKYYKYDDECVNSGVLREWVCSENEPSVTVLNCLTFGLNCNEGRCEKLFRR